MLYQACNDLPRTRRCPRARFILYALREVWVETVCRGIAKRLFVDMLLAFLSFCLVHSFFVLIEGFLPPEGGW